MTRAEYKKLCLSLKTWQPNHGPELKIFDMSDGHLKNTISYLRRKIDSLLVLKTDISKILKWRAYIFAFKKELRRRQQA